MRKFGIDKKATQNPGCAVSTLAIFGAMAKLLPHGRMSRVWHYICCVVRPLGYLVRWMMLCARPIQPTGSRQPLGFFASLRGVDSRNRKRHVGISICINGDTTSIILSISLAARRHRHLTTDVTLAKIFGKRRFFWTHPDVCGRSGGDPYGRAHRTPRCT